MSNLKRRRGGGDAISVALHVQYTVSKAVVSMLIGFAICIGLSLTRLQQPQQVSFQELLTVDVARPVEDADSDCIFRYSSIYRKVYVYPTPGEPEWKGEILSAAGQNLSSLPSWPWLEIDRISRENSRAHYNILSSNVQYTTELLVRELMVNPKSCLRTMDPEQATLFYVPYLPSVEHHVGHDAKTDYAFSPFGKAIINILDKQDYTDWENTYGLTSKYWKRRGGSDHILVFSEPMHGLFHPRNRRGSYHFIHSQKQLTPPIVISVELSTSFVSMYPNCAAKNILVPYPNTHGDWFNGLYAEQARQLLESTKLEVESSAAALPGEKVLSKEGNIDARPVAQYYSAGNHGTCRQLRRAMQSDYVQCAASDKVLKGTLQNPNFAIGMRLTTFCPAPGGDSPSAKRMFDALIAGCIPVILSEDFVWPATKEFDPLLKLDPSDFSIRLNASDYDTELLDRTTCQPLNASKPGLQAFLESISTSELKRLRRGVALAGKLFSWYATSDRVAQNPLRERALPDGGTAHFVVQALAERAAGSRWSSCESELKLPRGPDPSQFKC